MSIVDGHEITEVTNSGNYVTKCEKLINGDQQTVVTEGLPTCPDCLNPPVRIERPRKPRAANARPQWRTARNKRAETLQSYRFAHKAMVAAGEWFDRGEEEQFSKQALDQIHLAYRFLKEILVEHDLIQDDTPLDTE